MSRLSNQASDTRATVFHRPSIAAARAALGVGLVMTPVLGQTAQSNSLWQFGDWQLMLSFAITWTIGLAPPLITRYLLLRRPMAHAPAIAFAVIQYFANFTIFIALGSTSRTHAVLLVIGWVAYKILMRPLAVAKDDKHAEPVASQIESVPAPGGEPSPELRDPMPRLKRTESSAPLENGAAASAAANVAQVRAPGSDGQTVAGWWTRRRRAIVAGAAIAGAIVGGGWPALDSYVASGSIQWSRYVIPDAAQSHHRSDVDAAADAAAAAAAEQLYEAELASKSASGTSATETDRSEIAAIGDQLAKEGKLKYAAAPSPWDHTAAIQMAVWSIEGAVAGALTAIAILWPLGYPHPGWRRVAILAAPLAFIFVAGAGLLQDELDEPGWWVLAVIASVFAPSVTIVAVRTLHWVREGFRLA